ncbi:MAG: hypothetical protein GY761_11410 [Hyphomicrobiales bacterium]|nr:hypothetical protein [Hyphomicrobiales bacterium]
MQKRTNAQKRRARTSKSPPGHHSPVIGACAPVRHAWRTRNSPLAKTEPSIKA